MLRLRGFRRAVTGLGAGASGKAMWQGVVSLYERVGFRRQGGTWNDDKVLRPDAWEVRKAGWEALVSQLGVANSLRFLLQYNKGQGNYTLLRRKLFAGQTVGQILQDMAAEGIIPERSSAPEGNTS